MVALKALFQRAYPTALQKQLQIWEREVFYVSNVQLQESRAIFGKKDGDKNRMTIYGNAGSLRL